MKHKINETRPLEPGISPFLKDIFQVMATLFPAKSSPASYSSNLMDNNNNTEPTGRNGTAVPQPLHAVSAPNSFISEGTDTKFCSQRNKLLESVVVVSSASAGYDHSNGDKSPFMYRKDNMISFDPSPIRPSLPNSPLQPPNQKTPPEPGLQSIFAPPHPLHCSLNQTSSVLLHSQPSGHKKKPSNDEQKMKEGIDTNLNSVIPTTEEGGDGENEKDIPNDGDQQIEIDMIAFNPFESIEVRGEFLRKVLGVVGLQLLFVTAWTLACMNVEAIGNFVYYYSWIAYISIGIYLILYFAVGCLKCGRTCPSNLIILVLYTITLSYICGYVTLQYSTWLIMLSLSVTTSICLILSCITLFTKLDITSWGIYLTTGCCLMMLYAFSVFTCSFILTDTRTLSILHVTGAFLGASLVSVYLLYDLQMMIGGRFRSIDAEEWLFAAMALFYDLVMIFVYLVQVIGFGGNRPLGRHVNNQAAGRGGAGVPANPNPNSAGNVHPAGGQVQHV